MRTVVGRILIGLSGFFLLVGLLGLLWAPGQIKKTPLDVDSTTHLSGEGGRLDTSTGELDEGPLVATSVTKTDANASDDENVVFVSTSCLVKDEGDPPDCVDGDDPRLVTASESVFVTDRVSGEAVENGDYLPAGSPQLEGLVNKWPFDSEKKTYDYWDGTLGETVEAVYDREETVEGVDTYVYKIEIDEEPIEVAEGVNGTYSSTKEIFVEPLTGAIINQTDEQTRTLDSGTPALALQLGFTDEQIEESASDAKDNRGTINLVTRTVPIIGLVGGALLLAAGLFLILVGDRSRSSDDDDVFGDDTTTGHRASV